MPKNGGEKMAENETAVENIQNSTVKEKLSLRNLIMFPLGTIGRDFLYNFFSGYLISFILFTKQLTVAQFSSITIIIIAARIFDAFNDPIMGGIVENTRTKWGKYKPWQLIGAILTGAVIIALFNVNLDGWAFIGFLAFAYFMFSITFTMNDISYWGMMPTLTSNPHDRDKLTSFTQICCGLGGGAAGLLVPLFTTGAIGTAVFGSAVTGYRVLSVLVAVMMVGLQLFTILGVKEKPLPVNLQKTPPMRLKDMFKVLFKNDQLLWSALVLLLFNIGSGVFVSGLGMMYSYIEFGYDGLLWTVFTAGFSAVSTLFTLFYPWISKKLGRDRTLYSTGIALIVGFVLMMIFGTTLPNIYLFTVPFINVKITLKYLIMLLCYTLVGWGQGFYMIMVINMANTVEYNEFKTGKREEGLIFSLRPFTAKMGSAIMQGLVSLVYIIAGIITVTDGISKFENQAAQQLISNEEKLAGINNLIANIPEKNKIIFLILACMIPAVFLAVSLIIYKAKFKLNEQTMDHMLVEIEKRRNADEAAEIQPQVVFDDAHVGEETVADEQAESEQVENTEQENLDCEHDEIVEDIDVADFDIADDVQEEVAVDIDAE